MRLVRSLTTTLHPKTDVLCRDGAYRQPGTPVISGSLWAMPFYSHTGRPSIDPELMIRMLIVGYVFAIRSERQLCAEVQVNLAYRWFCGLGLEDRIPDHSVFSRARHERFRDADAFRRVLERVVGSYIAEGLVGGGAFSVDASLIRADVNPTKRVPSDEPIDWPDRQQPTPRLSCRLHTAGPSVHTSVEWSRSTYCASIAVRPQRRKHK